MASLNWWTAMFFVSLVNLWAHDAFGLLIVKPQNTYVLAEQVATLNCSTSSAEDVHWYYEKAYIYAGKKLFHPYLEKFKVDVYENDSSTAYNLVFLAAKPEDAGTYNCRDDQGRGDTSSADVIVFTADGNGTCQSNMKQDGVVIPNGCNIAPDEVQFSCSVTFYGKNPPQLEWKKVLDNGDSVTNTECQSANNRVTCNASVTGDQQMNHSSYECQTTGPGSSQLNIKLCTMEVKHLIYAFSATTTKKSTVGHEVQCNPNTSQTCHYKWKQSEVVVSTSRSISPTKTGLYQCEAICNIRGKSCIVFDYAYIIQSDDSTSSSIGCVVSTCLAILVLILACTFLFLLIKERSKNRQLSNKKIELEWSSMENGAKHERTGLMQPTKEMKTINCSYIGEPHLIRTLKPDAGLHVFERKAVFGVTILGNELFALIMGCPEIEVFDLQILEFRRKCFLKGHTLETPWDIQASSKFECLYIVDERKTEERSADIVKIDTEGNVQKIWSAQRQACRLSITREFNVIVTSLYSHTIREYSPDGYLIFEIELTSHVGIVNSWVTLKRGNEYIVSHGNRGDSQHRVCVIDQRGNLKHHFGGWKGTSNEQLYVPIHMVAYSDGRILVADKDNSRVVLLSPELEFIGAFFSQRLRFPNRICLDENNKRLFISDNQWISNQRPWNDGRILVYDMSSVQDSLHKHDCWKN